MTASSEAIMQSTLQRIRSVVGDSGVLTEEADKAPYLTDERGYYTGATPMVVRPSTVQETAAVVGICSETSTPIVPQGGNTGLCGAATPFEHGGEILLSLTRMNRIREIDPLNHTITVEAGVILADVQKAADDVDRYFPLSLGGEGTARIGGNLSTNAGGTAVLRYGPARDLCLGIEAVLPDGRVWNGLKALRKDNTGYDLKQLFIGAEGTLGIITAACLKLFPKPAEVQTAFLAVRDPSASIELLALARRLSDDRVVAFEYMARNALDFVFSHIAGARDPLSTRYEHYVLIELSSGAVSDDGLTSVFENILATAMEQDLVLDGTLASSSQHSDAFWKIRESIPEAQRHEGASAKHDISVPVSMVAEFLESASADMEAIVPGVRTCAFGHVGDGNVHFNLNRPVDMSDAEFLERVPDMQKRVFDIASAMNGSISAEHGIGRLRRDDLRIYKQDVAIDLMRAIKAAVDPKGIMNPGKVL